MEDYNAAKEDALPPIRHVRAKPFVWSELRRLPRAAATWHQVLEPGVGIAASGGSGSFTASRSGPHAMNVRIPSAGCVCSSECGSGPTAHVCSQTGAESFPTCGFVRGVDQRKRGLASRMPTSSVWTSNGRWG